MINDTALRTGQNQSTKIFYLPHKRADTAIQLCQCVEKKEGQLPLCGKKVGKRKMFHIIVTPVLDPDCVILLLSVDYVSLSSPD